MACDFDHRLVVSGAPDDVRAFQKAVSRSVVRRANKRGRSWRERVPLSFEAMYEVCPALRKIEAVPPCDPYDLGVSRVRRRLPGQVEVRYEFHTRNLEMQDILRVLSRKFPGVTLVLATYFLDGSSVSSYWLRRGRMTTHDVPDERTEFYWEQARERYGVEGDAIYEHDLASSDVDQAIFAEGLAHWDKPVARAWLRRLSATGKAAERPGRLPERSWGLKPHVRELDFERAVFMAQLSEKLVEGELAKNLAKRKRAPR